MSLWDDYKNGPYKIVEKVANWSTKLVKAILDFDVVARLRGEK
jgi:hypothetical protein